METLTWAYKPFNDLSAKELYNILKLRSEVFVVEQQCIYLDMDGKDQQGFHLCGYENDTLVAYARILPPSLSYEEASIGRVVTNPTYRKTGAGRSLMKLAIEKTYAQYDVTNIRIGAQKYLFSFYGSFGFTQCGPEYMEDGIPHVEMCLKR